MKTTTTFSLLVLTVTPTLAFSPMTAPTRTTATVNLQQPMSMTPMSRRHSNTFNTNTALFLSANTGDQLKEKADKVVTKFLVVDYDRAANNLADNWGWITASGFLTMVLGFSALYVPLFATGVAYDGTVITLALAGIVGIIGAFVRENGHKAKSAFSGVGYAGLAYYMYTHPGAGLDIITLTIASVLAVEGFYETALAAKNKNLQGRPWHFVSGIGSVLASAFLAANIPAASLVAPGVALGGRLTSSGATKMAVGLTGQELADQRKKNKKN